MFGCIVAGRLVQTNLQQVDSNKYVFELPEAQSINHIVVFLTGNIPFPEGYAATVHFYWPTPTPSWKLLGMLSNEKPSAIFKLASAITMPTSSSGMLEDMPVGVSAQLGISIEPVAQVLEQLQVGNAAISAAKPSTKLNSEQIATKVTQNLYDYCSSFSQSVVMNNGQNEQYFPLKV